MRGLSRREFFGGAAGAAALVAVPVGSARAALTPSARVTATARSTPLVGATVSPSTYGVTNYLDAANIFDGYVGLPMATTLAKVYLAAGQFPSRPGLEMTQLASAGCKFLVSVRPSTTMTPRERSALANWLAMLNSRRISYRVALYSESNDIGFTVSEWQAYWRYYAPVIKNAGVVCAYNPGLNPNSAPRATTYFPASPAPDEVWMDYYATAFRGGVRLGPLLAMARANGVPTGIAEWGWSAGKVAFTPMVMPWWNAFCNYLIHLANKRELPLGAILFGARGHGGSSGVISSVHDPRIPMIKRVAQAVRAS